MHPVTSIMNGKMAARIHFILLGRDRILLLSDRARARGAFCLGLEYSMDYSARIFKNSSPKELEKDQDPQVLSNLINNGILRLAWLDDSFR